MADDDGRGGGAPGGPLARFRHPRLVVTTAAGLALLGLSVVLHGSRPTLAVRVGIVGAVVALFGLTGLVAFAIAAAGPRD